MPKVAYTSEERALVQPALGRQVASRREQLSLSREQLGERIGRSEALIRQVEQGSTLVSLPLLIRLCLAFKCTPNELLSWRQL